MIARLFAIPAGLVVIILVGAAMFRGASDGPAAPGVIEPGQTAPHEDRGLCVACHLIGGPGPGFTGSVDTRTLNAPRIGANQLRPHGERGACVSCHEILPLTQTTAAGSQLADPAAFGTLMVAPVLQPVLPGYAMQGYLPMGGMPAQIGPGGQGMALQGMAPQGMAPQGMAPPIAQGASAPHGWRGQCPQCHSIGQTPQWQPTPPLPQAAMQPRRGPAEADAFGMSVRASNGDVEGVMVVEVEGLAKKIGLKLGDIIRAIDGKRTSDIRSFQAASRAGDPARGVVIDMMRDTEAQVLILR